MGELSWVGFFRLALFFLVLELKSSALPIKLRLTVKNFLNYLSGT